MVPVEQIAHAVKESLPNVIAELTISRNYYDHVLIDANRKLGELEDQHSASVSNLHKARDRQVRN